MNILRATALIAAFNLTFVEVQAASFFSGSRTLPANLRSLESKPADIMALADIARTLGYCQAPAESCTRALRELRSAASLWLSARQRGSLTIADEVRASYAIGLGLVSLMEALQQDYPEELAFGELPAVPAQAALANAAGASQSCFAGVTLASVTAHMKADLTGNGRIVHVNEDCDFHGFMICASGCSVEWGIIAATCFWTFAAPPAMLGCFMAVMVGDIACLYNCAHAYCPAHF